jgi:opacity protein-like surface antigen
MSRIFDQTFNKLNFKIMKKLMILVSAVALSGTMFAQKAGSDNPYSLEGAMNVSKDGVSWAAPNLRMRYFIKDNLALRLTLGRDAVSETSTETNTTYDSTGTATVTTSEVTTKNSIMNFGLAAEYHLAGTDRMSPYFTAGFKVGNDTRTEISTFGLNIGAGIDYYVAENIYVGLELGFNYNSSEGSSNSSFGNAASALRMGWRF